MGSSIPESQSRTCQGMHFVSHMRRFNHADLLSGREPDSGEGLEIVCLGIRRTPPTRRTACGSCFRRTGSPPAAGRKRMSLSPKSIRPAHRRQSRRHQTSGQRSMTAVRSSVCGITPLRRDASARSLAEVKARVFLRSTQQFEVELLLAVGNDSRDQ